MDIEDSYDSLPQLRLDGTELGFVALTDDDLCFMDDETLKFLELVENNMDSTNRKHSLFGYLNTNTSTTVGSRLLREILIRPYCHLETIEHRLDCVQYLAERVDTLAVICNCIKRFANGIDLDRFVQAMNNMVKSRIQTLNAAERRLELITDLESMINQTEKLIQILAKTDEVTLNLCKDVLYEPAFQDIKQEIDSILGGDVKESRGRRYKIFKIKTGVDSLFDMARNSYHATIDDMATYLNEITKESGLPWRMCKSEAKGQYLMLPTDRLSKNYELPNTYIIVNKSRQQITCTTKELMQLNVRANVSYENSMKIANDIFVSTLSSIIRHSASIQRLIELVGMLDLTTSFAKLVSLSNGRLVRPKFNATDTIIEGGRHPVMEHILHMNQLEFVQNDTRLKTRSGNFMLITGPNMGGKSVYLKQVALIQIMAQIGCYVPAKSAHIKLMSKIVARAGVNNENCSNCSSFMWEMKGIATGLVQDASKTHESALFIIDEVGRGTSIDCGASYGFAIAEELCLREDSFTLFATHFDQVYSLGSIYRNIITYHFQYEIETNEDGLTTNLNNKHVLSPGSAGKVHYGIELARICGFPDEIIAIACENFNNEPQMLH